MQKPDLSYILQVSVDSDVDVGHSSLPSCNPFSCDATIVDLVLVFIHLQLTSLELEAESAVAKMEDEHQEAKRARTIRFEYNRDVESVQMWIQSAEAKVQDKSVEPHTLKEFLQEIHCEIGSVTDQLERLTRHGHMICQRTSNQNERELVSNTIASLTEQLQQVRNWLEDKKAQVGDSLESWQMFIQFYNSLRNWVERQRNFLSEPLKFATLPEARGKLQEYAVSNVFMVKCMATRRSDTVSEISVEFCCCKSSCLSFLSKFLKNDDQVFLRLLSVMNFPVSYSFVWCALIHFYFSFL